MNAPQTTIVHPDGITESFGDDEDESSPPATMPSALPDMRTPPPPLPSVAGLSGREMEDLLGIHHQRMAGAILNWSNAGGGYPTHAHEHGLDSGDPRYVQALVKAEDAAVNAAEELRRHAQAVIAATERASVTLPSDLQDAAARRYPLLKGQVDALPLPDLVQRIRAAFMADDAPALSVYGDLLPGRLDTLPDSTNQREKDAAKELKGLLATANARLREKYGDSATIALHTKAVEMRSTASAAHGKANKRRMTKRVGDRLAASLQRLGMGTLVPVLDPKTGTPLTSDSGAPLLKRWDESDRDFYARQELDAERERVFRSRGTLVIQ